MNINTKNRIYAWFMLFWLVFLLICIIIGIIFSAYIWNVNASWGNPFEPCLILSTTTFLMIYTPFEIYWSFRDLYFDRWAPIKFGSLITSKIKIEVGKSKKGKRKRDSVIL